MRLPMRGDDFCRKRSGGSFVLDSEVDRRIGEAVSDTATESERLPRYGVRWNGPTDPICEPMADGLWTPWHEAEKRILALAAKLAQSEKMHDEVRAICAEAGVHHPRVLLAKLADATRANELAALRLNKREAQITAFEAELEALRRDKERKQRALEAIDSVIAWSDTFQNWYLLERPRSQAALALVRDAMRDGGEGGK